MRMDAAFEFFVEYVLIWLVLALILFLVLTPFQRLKQYYVQAFKWFKWVFIVVLAAFVVYLLTHPEKIYERVTDEPLTLLFPIAISILVYMMQKIYERSKREKKEDA